MAKILPVASGKGGVGKSLFVSNLSVILGEMGQRVVAVDLDLGGSNLHSIFGIKNNLKGLGYFINTKNATFDEIIHTTEYKNLRFIPGDSLYVGTANLPYFRKKKILQEISRIDADWIILDLGSGTAINTIDFYLCSNCGILVTTPDLTAILNLYSFIKNAVYRYMTLKFPKKTETGKKLSEAVTMKLEKDDLRLFDLFRLIQKEIPEEAENISKHLKNFYPKLIINMSSSEHDIALGENLRSLINKNIGLDIEYLGLLPYEQAAKQSVFSRQPLYHFGRNTKWIDNCRKIAERILAFNDYPISLFDNDTDSLDIVYSDLMESYK